MRTFHQLFGKSPFALLVEHTRRVHRTVELIEPLFEAFLAEDWETCEALYEKISKREHKADLEKNKVRDQLPKSMFLPVDRGDVLKYLKEQDSIADAAEDVAVLVTIRKTPCPEALKPLVLDFVAQVILTSERYKSAKSCANGIESVRKNSQDENRFETKTAKNGKSYFVLKAGNGQPIGKSQMYKSTSGCANGIKSVAANAPDAAVVEA